MTKLTVVPHSSASTEKIFSLLNHIKTTSNSLKQVPLRNKHVFFCVQSGFIKNH